jgi:hypothetical protein
MLLLVPRASSPSSQDYAMLGLGDVVIPGLLLTLAARADLASGWKAVAARPARGKGGWGLCSELGWGLGGGTYWLVASLGYGAGLALALLANAYNITINGVQGQPALLYLVPCTLGAVAGRAYLRGELSRLWDGSALEPTGTRQPVGAVPEGGSGFCEAGGRGAGAEDEPSVQQQLCGRGAASGCDNASHYTPLP